MKSFRSPLARAPSPLLLVSSSSCVEMLTSNVVAPFSFVRTPVSFVFSLPYGKLDDNLMQIGQLRRAATLPPVEQVRSFSNGVEYIMFEDSVSRTA